MSTPMGYLRATPANAADALAEIRAAVRWPSVHAFRVNASGNRAVVTFIPFGRHEDPHVQRSVAARDESYPVLVLEPCELRTGAVLSLRFSRNGQEWSYEPTSQADLRSVVDQHLHEIAMVRYPQQPGFRQAVEVEVQ